jgi:hypothetical protein
MKTYDLFIEKGVVAVIEHCAFGKTIATMEADKCHALRVVFKTMWNNTREKERTFQSTMMQIMFGIIQPEGQSIDLNRLKDCVDAVIEIRSKMLIQLRKDREVRLDQMAWEMARNRKAKKRS